MNRVISNNPPNHYIFIFSICLFFAINNINSKIIFRGNSKFNDIKLASLNGKFTSENLNTNIENWKVNINTILPKVPVSKNNPKEKNEFCSIIIEHSPLTSEVLVSQDPSNIGKNIVMKNDEIRYVSAKLPVKMEIFKGEFKDCSNYSYVKNLKELLQELNMNLSLEEQKQFLTLSYSRLLLQLYDSPYSLENYLYASYSNTELLKDILQIDPSKFKEDQINMVLDVLIQDIEKLALTHVELVLEKISPMYENQNDKILKIGTKLKEQINSKLNKLKPSLVKAEKNSLKTIIRTSKNILQDFFNHPIFTKQKTLILNSFVYKSPSEYFPEHKTVSLDDLVSLYAVELQNIFNNRINLTVKLSSPLIKILDEVIDDINGFFGSEMTGAKIDMFESSKVEDAFTKDFSKYIQNLFFRDLFALVILDTIKSKLKLYLENWFKNEYTVDFELISKDNEVDIKKLNDIYRLYGTKPFFNFPKKDYMINFFEMNNDKMLI